jgi:hypothetical protein
MTKGPEMDKQTENTYIELARRIGAGVEVALLWETGENETLVCVYDRREGAYFEIVVEPYLALDVFYHPFAYRDLSTADYQDERLAAA